MKKQELYEMKIMKNQYLPHKDNNLKNLQKQLNPF